MKIDIAYYELLDMFLALRQFYSGERFKPFNKAMSSFGEKLNPHQADIIERYGILTNGYLSALGRLIKKTLTEQGSGETYLLDIVENPESLFISDEDEIHDELIQSNFKKYLDHYQNKGGDQAKSIGNLLSTLWTDIFSREKAMHSKVLFEKIKKLKKIIEDTDVIDYLGSLSDRFYAENDILHFRIKPEYKIGINDIENVIIVPSIYASRNLTFWYENNNLIFFISLGADKIKDVEPSDMLLLITSALNDKTRLKILRYISQQNCTASDLAEYLQMNASTVSRHLKVFKDAGFIDIFSNDGKSIVYTINRQGIDMSLEKIKQFLNNKDKL